MQLHLIDRQGEKGEKAGGEVCVEREREREMCVGDKTEEGLV